MLNVRITSNAGEIEKALDGLPKKLEAARDSAGAVVARRLAEEVKERIPDRGGWYDIYRDAIKFTEISPGSWGVAGIAEVSFSQMEAETTLLWFQQGDESAAILAQYNPWTIDALPSVKDGIVADALVRPASKSETTHHRERLSGSTASIKKLLERIGKKIEPSELPRINGKIYADLDFLSRRMEFGLGGFERTPHWGPASHMVDKIANEAATKKAVEESLETDKAAEKASKIAAAASFLTKL